MRAQTLSLGDKTEAPKAPTLNHVKLGASFSGSGEPHVNLVPEVLRKIDVLNGEDRAQGLGRRRIAQEHGEGCSLGAVINPRGDGVAALEVNAVRYRVHGGDGAQGVDVEANMVLVRVVERGVLARVELHGDEARGVGEAEAAIAGGGDGGREGGVCWRKEKGYAVPERGRVEVGDGEGEGGGEGGGCVGVWVEEGDRVVV